MKTEATIPKSRMLMKRKLQDAGHVGLRLLVGHVGLRLLAGHVGLRFLTGHVGLRPLPAHVDIFVYQLIC